MQLCLTLGLFVLACLGVTAPELNPARNHQPPLPTVEPEGKAEASIRADVGWVGPNQTFHIIVPIKPVEGWHIYWKNPGASGAPTEFDVQAPEGFVIGNTIYPRPIGFYSEEGATYGYKKTAAFFIPITAPKQLDDGEVTFKGDAYWLACKSNCVRGTRTLTLSMKTKSEEGPQHKDMTLQRFKTVIPKPIRLLEESSVQFAGNALHITGQAIQRPISFIGDNTLGVRYFQNQTTIDVTESGFHLTIPTELDFANAGSDVIELEGLLLVGRNKTDPSYVIKKQVTQHELNTQ